MKNPKQTSLRWLKEAASTLESARKIFSRNEDYNLVCFLDPTSKIPSAAILANLLAAQEARTKVC